MTFWLSIPIIGILLMLQTSVVSYIKLLYGTADLVLLVIIAWSLQKDVKSAWSWAVVGGAMVGFVSALPMGVPLIGYLVVVGIVMLFRRRVWQYPFFIMIVVTILGTLVFQIVAYFSLRFTGVSLALTKSFNLIILPSILMNLIFSIPIYFLINELANWLYPKEVEV